MKSSLELVFNIVLMGLGLLILSMSLNLGFGSFQRPGTGLFPFFSGLLILVSNGMILIFRKKTMTGRPLFNRREVKTYLYLITVFVCWVLVMPLLGYLLVTLIATFSFSKVMGLKGWLRPLILSAGTALLCYLLFDYFLFTDLPRGILA